MPRKRLPTIGIVVPATNEPPTLERCLTAIQRSDDPPDEIIVVREPRTAGAAAARNIGAAQADSDIVLFVDADVEIHADVVGRVRDLFRRRSEIAGVFGAYDADPAAGRVVSDFRNLLHHFVHMRAAGPATTFWTGLGAVRRAALTSVGGFDERLSMMEDIDLGMRLTAANELLLLDPTIQGKHLKRWTLVGMVRTDFAGRGIPWIRLLLERRTMSTTLNLSWQDRTSALAVLALTGALLRRRTAPATIALAALLALNHEFYGLLRRRRGLRAAAAGVPLHVIHHLTGIAAVPAAFACHAWDRRSRERRRSE